MDYKEAYKQMQNGHKVRQGNLEYFLGKKARKEPYTLIIERGKIPVVVAGFKSINKDGEFELVSPIN